jgi:hypothetical protein
MAAETPLLAILTCARPVLLYNDSEAFPYSVSGTSFLVGYQGRLFAITAKHALMLRNFNVEQFRVQYRVDHPQTVPTEALYTFKTNDEGDTDQYDVAAWEVARHLVNRELFGTDRPFLLRDEDCQQGLSETSDYLYRGYPRTHRDIDFEARKYHLPSVSGAADYLGPDETIGRVHRLRFRNLDPLDDLDGLSGAPVFQVTRTRGKYSTAAFAGMLLRGTRASMSGYFLENRRIFELLSDIVAGRVDDISRPPR